MIGYLSDQSNNLDNVERKCLRDWGVRYEVNQRPVTSVNHTDGFDCYQPVKPFFLSVPTNPQRTPQMPNECQNLMEGGCR